jgi:hypothetical protein
MTAHYRDVLASLRTAYDGAAEHRDKRFQSLTLRRPSR